MLEAADPAITAVSSHKAGVAVAQIENRSPNVTLSSGRENDVLSIKDSSLCCTLYPGLRWGTVASVKGAMMLNLLVSWFPTTRKCKLKRQPNDNASF